MTSVGERGGASKAVDGRDQEKPCYRENAVGASSCVGKGWACG